MNAYLLTDRVWIVLQMAREEAARLNHEHVGTEHLLVLTNFGVDLKDVRRKIEQIVR